MDENFPNQIQLFKSVFKGREDVASAIFTRLKDNKKTAAIINKVCGLTLIGLGIKVALTNRKS